MEPLAKIVNAFQPLTIFAKSSILDVRQDSVYASAHNYQFALTPSGRNPYHIETIPLICSATQWTGFYMIRTSVLKELKLIKLFTDFSIIVRALMFFYFNGFFLKKGLICLASVLYGLCPKKYFNIS